MKNLSNIERSGFRTAEYVGYGGGKVWRIRKTIFGGWKWAAHVPGDDTVHTIYADTLADMSKRFTKLSQEIKA